MSEPARPATFGRWSLVGPAALFALSLALFGVVLRWLPALYDADSYYHLAIARAYAHHGLIDQLPWARFSLLYEFGDKELLFHLLLAPFAAPGDLTSEGGRWALALLNATVAAALAWLGVRAAGAWGLLVPVLVYGGSLDVLQRLIRLRPEILSLLLLLAAVWLAGHRRYRLLGAVTTLYTLSYTAFHALLGLCGLWFLQQLWKCRRAEWALVLYPTMGAGLGLVLHPHFPRNLVVWKVQSVDFFLRKGALDVGTEITPYDGPTLVWLNLVWGLALIALWRSAERRSPSEPADAGGRGYGRTTADFLWVTAAVFGFLYLLMGRFSTYFVPVTTLAVLFELRRRGLVPSPWLALPWRGRVPMALVLLVLLALGGARSFGFLNGLRDPKLPIEREQDWADFGRSLPAGARVAAGWGSTHIYMFWAPQAVFLNVLDPVFMALPYPQPHRALDAVLAAREPDVPYALRSLLASDVLAFSRKLVPAELIQRLDADPRLRRSFSGLFTLAYEIVEHPAAGFVLDWQVVPAGSRLPPTPADVGSWQQYPRAPRREELAVEGFVDATRIETAPACIALVHQETVAEETEVLYELAPYGPSQIWIDDRLVLATRETRKARLGRGVTLPARLSAGSHRVTVYTCTGEDGEGRSGFYLLERSRTVVEARNGPLPR